MASTGSLATGGTGTAVARNGDRRPAADRAMRRLLHVPERRPASADAAHRIFSVGIVLSALRCLLTYIFLPILAPLLGVAGGVGPSVGIPLAVVALGFDVMGIRRFWLADHRWRWTMTVVYVLVMGLVVALLVGNLETLFG